MVRKVALVRVARYQAVVFAGRTLGSVKMAGGMLVVNKKRERGNKYDNHYFSAARTLAYCEGPGGADGPAYAVVLVDATLRSIEGSVRRCVNGWIVIADQAGNNHYVTTAASTVSLVETDGNVPDAAFYGEPRSAQEQSPLSSDGTGRKMGLDAARTSVDSLRDGLRERAQQSSQGASAYVRQRLVPRQQLPTRST